ncbi:unnamed protein product [Rhizoctonia solani]|uniref:Kinesin light chain n=1 Tax=Rhizoctonia solani TaxID=456999 RepID=A0A8H3HVK3_9AGAM|nr:unnamed protein product [Rhizoctonia solani]CAE7148196.1 unnamed protein product [Rhizoctonia solani]
MCYDQLKPKSRELLWLIAYMHYDGISEGIFRRAAQNIQSKQYPLPPSDLELQARRLILQYLSGFLSDGKWDTIKFTGAMSDLTSYSLVDFDRMSLTYRLHVLVHDWAKTIIPHSSELAIECTATVISLSIDRRREEDAESLAFKLQLGQHVTTLLTRHPDVGANYCNDFTQVYSCTGQWMQKAALEEKLQIVFQQELGSNNILTWSAMHELASSYQALGQWGKALDLETRVADAYKRMLIEEHPDILSSMSSLASIYSDLGRHQEAEKLKVQVLDARKRKLGEEHRDTLASMHNLAMTYTDLGRHHQAEQLKVKILAAYKHKLGEGHSDTLAAMNNLALTYLHLGRRHEAEQLQVQVLDAHKRIFGEEHPHTMISMLNLALTYSRLGRHRDAEQLGIQVLDTRKRLLGEEHPKTLVAMHNLAVTYSNLGRWDESKQLHSKAINAAERTLGSQHPTTRFFRIHLMLMHIWRYIQLVSIFYFYLIYNSQSRNLAKPSYFLHI